MLRICSLAGETLATFSADEVEGKRVHQLKVCLAKQIGATRFQQKWLAGDHTELHDDAVVPCCDVQLVVLPFAQAEDEDMEQLVSACKQNRPDELVDLLRKPLNPHGGCERRVFVQDLSWAAKNGHWQIVQLLLEAGADKDATASDGKTPLHIAATGGHSEVVKLLLEAGAYRDVVPAELCPHLLGFWQDVINMGTENYTAKVERKTPLQVAAMKGHSEVVKLLLEAGADKEAAPAEQNRGKRALHLAAENGHWQNVQLLLEAGADKDATDHCGMTALHFAAERGHSKVVELLVEANAAVEEKSDRYLRTAFYLAVKHGHSEVVKLLLEAGCDKDAGDLDGMTALHWAAQRGHSEVVKLLLQAGADEGVADSGGRLPLDLAVHNDHSDVVDLLQSNR